MNVENPTPTQLAMQRLIAALGLLKFFNGSDPLTRLELIDQISQFATTAEQLNWLRNAVLVHYTEWPGVAELRAVFCTKFRPADGIERYLPSGSLAQAPKGWEPGQLDGGETQLQIEGTVERMPEKELAEFHNSLFTPLLNVKAMPGSPLDKQRMRQAEEEIKSSHPTLSAEEKARRVRELEVALGLSAQGTERCDAARR